MLIIFFHLFISYLSFLYHIFWSNFLPYPNSFHILPQLSIHPNSYSFSLWRKQEQNRQATTTTNTWNTHPKWGCIYQTPQDSGHHVKEEAKRSLEPRWWVTPRKWCFQTQQSWHTYELTETRTAWTGPAQTHGLKPNKMPILRRGSGHKVPSPAKKPFPIDSQLREGKAFSLIEW